MSFFKNAFNILTERRDIKEPIVFKGIDESNLMIDHLTQLSTSKDTTIDLKKVNEHLKLFSIGHSGEKSVMFELQHSMIPSIILHDLYLEVGEYTAQLDFVVITHKFILVIEVKKLVGDIELTEREEFIRVIRRNNRIVRKEGMYSPVNQAERHVATLEKLLKDKGLIKRCPVYYVVTFANPKTIIDISKKASKQLKSSIIRHDQIKSFLAEKLTQESPVYMLDHKLHQIAEVLKENAQEKQINLESYYIEVKENPKDKIIITEEKLSDDELREKLTKYRLEKSRALEIKPFYIFTNKTLDGLITERPKTIEMLLKVEGIGPKKAKDYGEEILAIINQN
ncbi:NERD domain-containing protein [Amphibacillus indicireducens]|uniref:HRDC domain-containing protein n=1 Tax=Amphibacillus indicireducens TaxID=1076330 RepID=A0ABP7W2Z7_9BACI